MKEQTETVEDRKQRFFLEDDAKVERLKDKHDTTKRFKHLLSLTDLFRHFIDVRASRDPTVKKLLRQLDTEKKSTKKKTTKTRRRKTEQEEDAELIHDEEFEEETTVLTETPSYIHGKLRDYQIQGLNWLISLYENSLSGILADEMGLGKTLQTIAFLGHLRYNRNIDGPFIVIVPKSTLDNWRREFERWTPDVKVAVLQGNKEHRHKFMKNTVLECDFDVLVTSFEMVIKEKAALKKFRWEYIIVDEAHRIKNEESALSQIIRLFYSKNRLLITGTPLQNNLHELWALLNFILPDLFGDSDVFDQWFENQEEDQDVIVQQLHKVLNPFLLRRVKSDVEKSLLPKKEQNLYVGMTEMQRKWYKNLLEKDIDAVNGVVGKREGKTRLLNIVMQLRKCCNHPYLFEGAEPGPPYTTDEHLIFNSGKMIVLDKLLKKMKEQGSRVLIFSQMSRVLDILEDYCFFRDYEYCRIDGSTAHEERIAAIDDYNDPESDKFIFLLTTRAGGLGINLTSADIVILYDSDWNPQADLQAMDRAHRIGQKKQVHVFRFVTENAVEEKVIERATQKLRLDQLVIQQGRSSNKNTTIGSNSDDLVSMIQFGAKDVFESKGESVETDIDAILKRSEEKTTELNKKYSSLGLDDLQKFTSEQSAYEWNGENFAKKNNPDGFGWINPSKRERKEQTYSVDGYYKDVLATKSTPQPRTPRAPKIVNIQDHQFFNTNLKSLLEREQLFFKKSVNYKVSVSDFDDEEETDGSGLTRSERKKLEQEKIDSSIGLSPEEEELKQKYINEAFTDWSRRDFTNFIQFCAKFGRERTALIAEKFNNKSLEEVESYSKVFWERYNEIEGHEKYIAQIEAGEKKAQRLNNQAKLLSQKIGQVKRPLTELNIQYPPNNSKRLYSEAEDRFLLVTANKIGLFHENVYERVKQHIRKSEYFRFDWFFLSRTAQELSRRISTLLLAITREFEGPEALKRKRNRINNAPENFGTTSPQISRQGTVEPTAGSLLSSDDAISKNDDLEPEEKKIKI